jgi:hypothetical protein
MATEVQQPQEDTPYVHPYKYSNITVQGQLVSDLDAFREAEKFYRLYLLRKFQEND